MLYRTRFRRRAKEELKRAKRYSSDFSDDLDQWLADIANSSTEQVTSDSIDLLQLLDEGAELAENPSRWKYLWKKWWASTPIKKVEALIIVIRKRCPPWHIRATSRWFCGILGAFDCEVHACYEVNHIDREIVFTKFIGLPGED